MDKTFCRILVFESSFFKFLDFSRNQPQNCYLVMKRDSTKIDNAT